MRTLYSSALSRPWRALVATAALSLTACGSSGGQVKATDSSSKTTKGGKAGGASSASASGFTDEDFELRQITEAKAPVYVEGITPEAQDAFREGVLLVSLSRPDLKQAEEKFKLAASKAPNFLEAFFNWGQTLERQGKGSEALQVYQSALDKNPGDATASAYVAKVYLGNARAARLLGNTSEANTLMERAKSLLDPLVQKDPTNVQVNNAIALYFLMQDDLETAERYVKEVLFVEPSNVTGLNTRGLINLKQGKLLLAKWIFENKVLREDPSSTEAHTNLGYTYIKLDQRPLAMRHFEQALEVDPENMEVRANIAAMLLEHLDYNGALGHYEQVLKSQPNNMEAKIGRCDSMYGAGGMAEDKKAQYEKAIACYDAFVKERPERTDLIRRIAETYQNKVQNLEKAISYYEQYGQKAQLSAEAADQNRKVIQVLKDIIASGGLNQTIEEAPPAEDDSSTEN